MSSKYSYKGIDLSGGLFISNGNTRAGVGVNNFPDFNTATNDSQRYTSSEIFNAYSFNNQNILDNSYKVNSVTLTTDWQTMTLPTWVSAIKLDLQHLVGDTGDKGDAGVQGDTGPPGPKNGSVCYYKGDLRNYTFNGGPGGPGGAGGPGGPGGPGGDGGDGGSARIYSILNVSDTNRTILFNTNPNYNAVSLYDANNTPINIKLYKGTKGAKGAKGAKGPTGPQGGYGGECDHEQGGKSGSNGGTGTTAGASTTPGTTGVKGEPGTAGIYESPGSVTITNVTQRNNVSRADIFFFIKPT